MTPPRSPSSFPTQERLAFPFISHHQMLTFLYSSPLRPRLTKKETRYPSMLSFNLAFTCGINFGINALDLLPHRMKPPLLKMAKEPCPRSPRQQRQLPLTPPMLRFLLPTFSATSSWVSCLLGFWVLWSHGCGRSSG